MTSSYMTKQITTDHKDLIQDIAFDFHGKRVATASLDQSVKIWNIDDNNKWIFKEELKINPGLYKVAWAHPEFGSLIAVACDRLVWIYEETCFGSGKNTHGWVRRTPALSDARSAVTDLKFAPKFLGLQLAICAQNGEVRIYECADILSSNGGWTVVHSDLKTMMSSCSSCSWSTCFNLPFLLAIGSDESNTPADKLVIFEYNEDKRNYSRIEKQSVICSEPIRSLAFAPSVGKLYHVLAIASRSLMVSTIRPTMLKRGGGGGGANINSNAGGGGQGQGQNEKVPQEYTISTVTLDTDVSTWRVCWNTVGSVLASAGDDRKVRLWKCNYNSTWKCFAEITGDSCSTLIGPNFNEEMLLSQNADNVNNPMNNNNMNNENNDENNQQQRQIDCRQ